MSKKSPPSSKRFVVYLHDGPSLSSREPTRVGDWSDRTIAEMECTAIVQRSLQALYREGISAPELLEAYLKGGKIPTIEPPNPPYPAEQTAGEICERLCGTRRMSLEQLLANLDESRRSQLVLASSKGGAVLHLFAIRDEELKLIQNVDVLGTELATARNRASKLDVLLGHKYGSAVWAWGSERFLIWAMSKKTFLLRAALMGRRELMIPGAPSVPVAEIARVESWVADDSTSYGLSLELKDGRGIELFKEKNKGTQYWEDNLDRDADWCNRLARQLGQWLEVPYVEFE